MSDPNNPSVPPPQDPQPNPPNTTPPPSNPPPPAPAQPVDYQGPSASGYPGPYIGPPADSDSRTMALLGHILGIVTGPIGPLIIWLIKKDEKPFVDDQGKEALNFQLTILIAWVGVMILSCITFGLGTILLLPLIAVVIIFAILAAVEANKGNAYRYPVNIRFIK